MNEQFILSNQRELYTQKWTRIHSYDSLATMFSKKKLQMVSNNSLEMLSD